MLARVFERRKNIMKKLWIVLTLLTMAGGFVLCYLGVLYENRMMERSGIAVLFGGSFAAILAQIIAGAFRAYKRETDAGVKDDALSFDTDDRSEVAIYLFGGSILSGNIKQKNVVLVSTALQITAIGSFFVGILLLFLHQTLAAAVCLAAFGIMIFVCMLTATVKFLYSAVKEAKEKGGLQDEPRDGRIGTVKSCALSPTKNDGGEKMYLIEIAIDGTVYTTANRNFYAEGSKVVASTQGNLALIDTAATEKLQQNKE